MKSSEIHPGRVYRLPHGRYSPGALVLVTAVAPRPVYGRSSRSGATTMRVHGRKLWADGSLGSPDTWAPGQIVVEWEPSLEAARARLIVQHDEEAAARQAALRRAEDRLVILDRWVRFIGDSIGYSEIAALLGSTWSVKVAEDNVRRLVAILDGLGLLGPARTVDEIRADLLDPAGPHRSMLARTWIDPDVDLDDDEDDEDEVLVVEPLGDPDPEGFSS